MSKFISTGFPKLDRMIGSLDIRFNRATLWICPVTLFVLGRREYKPFFIWLFVVNPFFPNTTLSYICTKLYHSLSE